MQKQMKVQVTEVQEQDWLKRKGEWYRVLRVLKGQPFTRTGHTKLILSEMVTFEQISVVAPDSLHYLVERTDVA